MDLELKGKLALVTGSSRGIGRAIAEKLASEGCDVVLNARGSADLERACDDLRQKYPNQKIVGCSADLSAAPEISKLKEKIERSLDVLILNIGSGSSTTK